MKENRLKLLWIYLDFIDNLLNCWNPKSIVSENLFLKCLKTEFDVRMMLIFLVKFIAHFDF